MKFSVLILLALLLSSPQIEARENVDASNRINKLLRFIANQTSLREFALYKLLAKRCKRYLPKGENGPCREAVRREIQLLDYDIIFTNGHEFDPSKESRNPDAFVFIAFKKSLIEILTDPKTTDYLMEIKDGLNGYLTGEAPQFNIWDATLKRYKSPLLAAKVMAALFQDTSLIKLHIAYLERSREGGRLSFQSNLERLSKVIDTINLVLDYSEDNFRALFYPHPLRENLNRNIYHFYVPLYLAMALAAEGTPRKYALAGPLMLTLTYEFVTMSNDYQYLMKDPFAISSKGHLPTLKDIFAGFSGANFGIGKIVPGSFFTKVSESFGHSTHEGVSLLLNP